jgi:outer membrane protein OmpA-like peptidoglycan-associated protein
VPSVDLDGRFLESVAATETPNVAPARRRHHLRCAAWAGLELGFRVRAEAAREQCAQAWAEALELADYRDRALWAMVDLERSMKEGVRRELDEERQRMADREQSLYESLKQFEGEFAKIRREARGTIMSLSDILFDFGKADLRREAELNLAKMAVIFQQYPEMSILIEGHTDNIGSEEYNLKLSERRAQAVYDFLSGQGVAEERMSTKGYGLSQPVEANATPEGRQANRRVDLVIRES